MSQQHGLDGLMLPRHRNPVTALGSLNGRAVVPLFCDNSHLAKNQILKSAGAYNGQSQCRTT